MNKAKLKTYAPQARKDFIAAVTQCANLLGLSESAGRFEALPAERRGDVVPIAARELPARVAPQRERLVRRIRRDGRADHVQRTLGQLVEHTGQDPFAAVQGVNADVMIDATVLRTLPMAVPLGIMVGLTSKATQAPGQT